MQNILYPYGWCPAAEEAAASRFLRRSMVTVERVAGCRVADAGVDGLVDILLEDGTIREIVPASGRAAGPGEVDANGMVAVPGLTNAHTHTPLSLMKGAAEDVSVDDWFNKRVWPMEMNLTPERVKVGARLACAEMLLSGVTGFADHYFFADQIAAAAQELGIRANIAPTFFSEPGGASREGAFDQTRGIVEMDSRLVPASVGPHAPYTVSDDDLHLVSDLARSLGVRVHIHAAENMQQTESSLERLGCTPMTVLERTGILDAGVLIAHGGGIIASDRDVLEPAADRVSVACCPKVYFKHDIDPITPVRLLHEWGIGVGAGTDGPPAATPWTSGKRCGGQRLRRNARSTTRSSCLSPTRSLWGQGEAPSLRRTREQAS